MKNFKILIAVGVMNIIHGSIHIFQFIQSMLLTYYSVSNKESGAWIHKLMESPWMGLVWGFIGFITLYIGYQDYEHHKIENHK
jgi:hypothetical protein